MRRALVSLVLVVSACGGATDSSSGSTPPQAVAASETTTEDSAEPEVHAVVDAVVAAHGEDGGFNAVIWAFERGYSAEQLFAGALDGRVQADGVITAAAGGTESPEGSPLGLIVLPDPEFQSLGITAVPAVYRVASHMSAAYQGTSVEEFKKLLGPEVSGLLVIVDAARAGYSGQQIIELIIENGSFDYLDSGDDRSCTFLRDGTGRVVVPGIVASELNFDRKDCIQATNELADVEKAERDAGAEAEVETSNANGRDEEPSISSSVYEQALDLDQEFLTEGSRISVSILSDTPEAAIEVVINTFATIPAFGPEPECRSDETFAAEAVMPVTNSSIDASFTGTHTVAVGTCGTGHGLATGQEEATFTLTLSLGSQLAEGTLIFTTPTMEDFGFEPFMVFITATAVGES